MKRTPYIRAVCSASIVATFACGAWRGNDESARRGENAAAPLPSAPPRVLDPPAVDSRILHPGFPVVEGRYQMTSDWSVTLPAPFNRRFEDESLVLWRPGITVWAIIWGNEDELTQEESLEALQRDTSPSAFSVEVVRDERVLRYAYRLVEKRENAVVHALYAFVIGRRGHVQMAIYLDDEADLETARAIANSLDEALEP